MVDGRFNRGGYPEMGWDGMANGGRLRQRDRGAVVGRSCHLQGVSDTVDNMMISVKRSRQSNN